MHDVQDGFRLIVFDWDGTLMDSEARIVDCLRRAAEAAGLPALPAERLREVIGLSLDGAFARLYPEAGAATRARLAEAYREEFLHRNPTPSRLFPGARELLSRLHAGGRLLAVATGKARRGLDRVLAETGLGRYLHASRCADETASKPSPRMLHEILDELAVAPGQALMVGDTDYDLEMARAAGVAAVGVTHGVHDAERLRRHRPLALVPDLHALDRWLAGPAAAVS